MSLGLELINRIVNSFAQEWILRQFMYKLQMAHTGNRIFHQLLPVSLKVLKESIRKYILTVSTLNTTMLYQMYCAQRM